MHGGLLCFSGFCTTKKGVKALVWSAIISAPFAIFLCSAFRSYGLAGHRPLGRGHGRTSPILKAAMTNMVPKASRATGYGIFECSFGVFWFLGSWLMGVLYDVSIPAMIVSVATQLMAILSVGLSDLLIVFEIAVE